MICPRCKADVDLLKFTTSGVMCRKCHAAGGEAKAAQQYESRVLAMAERARTWRENNPDRVAKVQFNFPPQVCLIATINDAIEHGYVTTNEAGAELVQALRAPGEDEPTVLMVRIALEGEP
jgi:hypothetical protein